MYEFCIPTRGTAVPAGPDWYHEIKYDGFRLLVLRTCLGELHIPSWGFEQGVFSRGQLRRIVTAREKVPIDVERHCDR